MGVLRTAASTRAEYGDLSSLYLPVAIAVFVLVAGLLLALAARGLLRRGAPSRRSKRTALEGALVAVLALTAAGLIAATFRTDARSSDAGAGLPALRVNATAAKWNWRFSYPQLGIVEQGTDARTPTLVVPSGRRIEFAGRSLDVIHGFWVPSERFQRELFPGRVVRFALTFRRSDSGSPGECSFFCGLRHAQMRFRVRVLAPAAFDAWARRRGSRR